MSDKRKRWSTFLFSIGIFYVFILVRSIWWQMKSQANLFSVQAFILIFLIITMSISVGALVMTSMDKASSNKAIFWGIISSMFPPNGLVKYITLRKREFIKLIFVISLSMIYIFCGIQLIINTPLTENMNRGTISLNYENSWGNQLQLDFKSATKNFIEQKKFELNDEDDILYINGECGGGSFLVEIIQGNTRKQWTITKGKFEQKISLDFLDAGSFIMNIHIQNATNTNLKAKIK
ncbi:MAG: hypothetical protein ACK5NA_07705 [Enterococcus sp.]